MRPITSPASPHAAAVTGFPALRWSHRGALWLQASIITSFLAASTAPSPLYALYQEAWGFSALTLTLVFSSYAFALLAALLVFGALSDHRGRRPVILAALVLELVAVAMFHQADSVGWLAASRIVQGVATGIVTAAVSAGLLDLHRERGSLVNSIAPMIGMAVGALGTAALVEWTDAPLLYTFDVLLVVIALQTLAALFLPETVEPREGAWRSMRPRIDIPPRIRPTMWALLPVNTAQWALGGFFMSLGPTLARGVTGIDSPLVGGSLIACMVLSTTAAILRVRHRTARLALVSGAGALALGLAVTLAGMATHTTPLFFGGTAIAGWGFGSALNGSMRSLVMQAEAHERAGLMAGFFVLSYLAFALPAIGAGLAVGVFGLHATALGYAALMIAASLVACVMMSRATAPSRR